MPDAYHIRAATSADAEAAGRIWSVMAEQHRAYDAEVWCWSDRAERSWSDHFRQMIDTDEMIGLLAESDAGRVTGIVVAVVKESADVFETTRSGFVWDLCVLPEARGCGLGRRLMEAAFDEMRRRGCDDVILHVGLENRAAIGLYEKLGMRPVMYRMYRRLTPADDDRTPDG